MGEHQQCLSHLHTYILTSLRQLQKIRLGGVVIDFNPEFRLFLLTRRSDTSWSADVSDRLTVVNFLVSHKGVEDALLSVLVAQEAPELQRRKLELLQLSADNERQLKGLEDRILEVLSTTKGNILDDQTAVEMLGSAKELSDAVIEEQVGGVLLSSHS